MLIAPEIGFEKQVNTATTNQPISAFQALGLRYLYATMAALFAVAFALAFVPRQVFQSESLIELSSLITAYWPKLEADRMSLQKANPGFADKFVISYTVLAAVAALMLVILSLHLLVKAIREGAELKGSSIDTKFFCRLPRSFCSSAGCACSSPRHSWIALAFRPSFPVGRWR